VNLAGTHLEGRPLKKHSEDRSEEDWVFYQVEQNVFRARGGAESLAEMIDFFLTWAEEEG
jgi:hypothetical protein